MAKMAIRIFDSTKTVLRDDGKASWIFNRGDQVKNVTRISETIVAFEPGDNVATSGGTYVMDRLNFEMITRELAGNGFYTSHVQSEWVPEFERTHSRFLLDVGLDSWDLRLVGTQEGPISAASKAPDGEVATEAIQQRLPSDMAMSLRNFLFREYEGWKKRLNVSPKAAAEKA